MTNPKALIVEDDRDLATIFAKALEAAEFDVQVFYAGEPAIDCLKGATPDVVVLDLNLPGVSGEAVLKHIRADERLAKTRVILATANHLLARMLDQEADFVLVKPITFSQLRDLTRRLRANT